MVDMERLDFHAAQRIKLTICPYKEVYYNSIIYHFHQNECNYLGRSLVLHRGIYCLLHLVFASTGRLGFNLPAYTKFCQNKKDAEENLCLIIP